MRRQCEPPLTFDDFDILASDSNKYKLLVNENLLIKRDKPVLSRATKSFPLDLFDQVLFPFYKKYDQFPMFIRERKNIYEPIKMIIE